MHIFMTGATGYIGSAVLDALIRAGHQISALVRRPGQAARLAARGVTPVMGDLEAPHTYLPVIAGQDAVVHTALEGSAKRAEKEALALDAVLPALAAGSGPRAFVYTSGVWVLGDTSTATDETMPVNPIAFSAWRVPHEARVLAAGGNGLRTIVIRPGIVYGGGRGIITDLLKEALNGLVRVMGAAENRWASVYDRDLADLYARGLSSPGASGVFHATDESDERVIDIVQAMANHVVMRPDIRHVPIEEARQKLGGYADALALDQCVRSPRARALGWTPTLRSISGNVPRLFEELRASGV
ncbi:MAG: NAD(P)H-binding protein [Acidobacteria bacterium]|nr:NAD(P)H-binding protein [Acidobacteriota bacterium]